MTELLEDVPENFRPAVAAALEAAGAEPGHLAVEVVAPDRIHDLNLRFRGVDRPTDVLSFPVDEARPGPGPREYGDVVICPAHCVDETEAVVHGVLHLLGHDHERDRGEMLELQGEILTGLGIRPTMVNDDD